MKKKKNTVNNGLENALGLNNENLNIIPTYAFINSSPNLISLNYIPIANMYKSNGFVATVVDLPVSDAFRNGGFEIDSNILTSEELLQLEEKMSDCNDIETLKDCIRWGRLYGGGCILISAGKTNDSFFNPETVYNKEVNFYAVDRWQCIAQGTSLQLSEKFNLQDNLRHENGTGIIFDKSRVLTYTGKTQPYYIRNMLQGWGTSILEDVIPHLNQYLKANNVILELLDEAKIDILKISGLANLLASADGEQLVKRRASIAAQEKNYKSMLVMDSEDDYDHKQMSFASLDNILDKIFLMICSCLRIPYSKVFGKGANGFSSGEDDLENYNAMIDSEIRVPVTKILKQMIDIRCYQLFGKKDESLKIIWKPLRVLSEKEEQEIKNSKINSFIQLKNAGILSAKQVAEKLSNEDIIAFSEEELNQLEDEISLEEFNDKEK